MATVWFWVVSVMVTVYAVMDGFDFGAGTLHLFVARTDRERRQVLAAIGPWWDGNEVWLLAAGGALFMAFPRVLAASFSGFYLAMFLVIWTLLLRGIGIEFRSHLEDGLWRAFWDTVFAGASLLLPLLLGVALGNVVRGVPLDASGYFNIPLFTHFGPANPVGILDWYTLLIGAFALLTLGAHGANFLAWKTEGPVRERAVALALPMWVGVALLWFLATVATARVAPGVFMGWSTSPLAWLGTAVYAIGLGLTFLGLRQGRHLMAFLGSSAFILGLLGATAASVFPVLLRSSLAPEWNLTAFNASSGAPGMAKALGWWVLGFPLAVGYFGFLFWRFQGKVQVAEEDEGY